ncbi:MAG: DUF6434 domain-containing protein [Pseudomonadota bacterium]
MTEIRPDIEEIFTGAELRRWYWLKSELAEHAARLELSATGSKEEITERIAHLLDTGQKLGARKRRAASKFNWAREVLTPDTIITDSYTNGPNVRAFFKEHYGPKFTFNIAFMDWMRSNVGKTLGDAVEARREIAEREKHSKPAIPASNQYNAYTRDFHAANPDLSQADARACWAWKRSRPGHNRYEEDDLQALEVRSG